MNLSFNNMEYKHYLNIFSSQSDYESQKDEVMDMPHVVLLEDTKEVIFASNKNEIDYASQPFTIVALEDGTMDIALPSGATFMNYSLNDGAWVDNTEDIALEVKANDKVKLKANAISVSNIFDLSMPFNAEGNIMSLLYGNDFKDKKTIESERCFAYTFKETNIVSAKNLILPATTLTDTCYGGMFYYCTSLIEAPELPATTLATWCYYGMFDGCSSLNKITMLATDISASNCLYDWVNGVSSSGTFIKNSAMTSLPSGINGIPSGWTVQDYQG